MSPNNFRLALVIGLAVVSGVANAENVSDLTPPRRWCGPFPGWSVEKSSKSEIIVSCADVLQFLAEVNLYSDWRLVYEGPDSTIVVTGGYNPNDLTKMLRVLGYAFDLKVYRRDRLKRVIYLKGTSKFREGQPSRFLGPLVTADQAQAGSAVLPVVPGTCKVFPDDMGTWTWCNRMPLEAALQAFNAQSEVKIALSTPLTHPTCITFAQLPDADNFATALGAHNLHVVSRRSTEIVMAGEPRESVDDSCVAVGAVPAPP